MQMSGILLKQPFGPKNQSTKWTKRFFVLKDGYLLYYLDGDKKDFEKKQFIHLHPKGILPLGGCLADVASEAGHPFCIRIRSLEINNEFVVAAETETDRKSWLNALIHSTRITWVNAQLGDAMIEQLERHGLQLAIERQNYADRLHTETIESTNYKEMAQELKKLNDELAEENSKLEQLVQSMRNEQDELNKKLEETLNALSLVEDTKASLQSTFRKLESNLEELDKQKRSIESALEEKVKESRKLTTEKDNLSKDSVELSSRLAAVEDEMKAIAGKREKAEQSLKEHELKAIQLQEDIRYTEERANQLQTSIQELNAQKASTEAELQEEIQARKAAEMRLAEVEESLVRLDSLITQHGDSIHEHQMMSDVKTLKRFFENLVFESKLDARKCLMIKQSIEAKKAIIKRSKPNRFSNRQSLPQGLSSLVNAQVKVTSSSSSSSSLSAPDDLTFQRSAEICWNAPGIRNTVIGLFMEIENSQL